MLRIDINPRIGSGGGEPETHDASPSSYWSIQTNLAGTSDSHLWLPFERFGPREKTPNYEVQIDWLDIESKIRTLQESDILKRSLEATLELTRASSAQDARMTRACLVLGDLLPSEQLKGQALASIVAARVHVSGLHVEESFWSEYFGPF